MVGKQNQVLLQFITYNFSKAENPRKFAAANTPTASASVTVISLSFSYNAARVRAKAEKRFFFQKVIKLTVSYAVAWDGRPILMPGPNLKSPKCFKIALHLGDHDHDLSQLLRKRAAWFYFMSEY